MSAHKNRRGASTTLRIGVKGPSSTRLLSHQGLRGMNPCDGTPAFGNQSPWLDPKTRNLFLDEFNLINDLKTDPWLEQANPYFKPIELYRWIDQNNGVSLFFRGLARYAPMFPVFAYNGQVASWISPPPSGRGNAILMVMGHDKTGKLRLVGGNRFTEPTGTGGSPLSSTDFFNRYDTANDRDKERLVRETVSQNICLGDESLLRSISRECEHFHTMAIYITILTATGSLFHAAKAVIEGDRPAGFSYEYFGEVK